MRKIVTLLRPEQSHPVTRGVKGQPTNGVLCLLPILLGNKIEFLWRAKRKICFYPENGDSLSFGSIPCCNTEVSSSMFPLRALANITLFGSFSSSLLKDFVVCFSTLDAAVPILSSCSSPFSFSVSSLFPGYLFTIVTFSN